MRDSIFLFFIFLCSAGPVLAAEDSYNGNLVLCPGQKTVTLDYYDTALEVLDPNGPNVVRLAGMSQQGVIDFALNRLEGTLYQKQLENALAIIRPVEGWIVADLKDTSRSWRKYDLKGDCKRVQGSARISNVMYVDPLYARALDQAQLGILRLHEAVALVGGVKPQYGGYDYDSVPLERELIRRILNLDYAILDLGEAIRALGHKAFAYETVLDPMTGTIGEQINAQVPDGHRACNIVVRGADEKNTTYFLEYTESYSLFDDSRFCRIAERPKIKCSLDATQCVVVEGELKDGWKAGCKIEISRSSNQRSLWTFRCPDSTKAWKFQF